MYNYKNHLKRQKEAKNFPRTTQVLSLKYVFIIFFETYQMLKYTFHAHLILYIYLVFINVILNIIQKLV